MASPFGRTFLYRAASGGLDLTTGGTIGGNLIVTGTMNVTGAVDLDSTLNVDGTANIEGATTVDDNLLVTGTTTSTGQFIAALGSNAAPGYAFTGLLSTGLHANSNNPGLSRAGAGQFTCSASNMAMVNNFVVGNDFAAQRAFQIEAEAIKVADYLTTTADTVVVMNGTALTATLPASPASSQMLWIKNIDAGTCTVARNAKTIDGGTVDITLLSTEGCLLHYNGTGWHILSRGI